MIHSIRKTAMRLTQGTPLESFARNLHSRIFHPRAAAYDRQTVKVIRRVLGPEGVAVDVGAYRGEILKIMLQAAPRGTVYGIEPVERNCEYLREKFPEAIVYHCALGSEKSEVTFYEVEGRPARSGLRKQKYPDPDEKVRPVRVELNTLDGLMPAGVGVDLIKIDVEGAEMEVLKGGTEMLSQSKPILILEHDVGTAANYEVRPGDLYRFLCPNFGYRISTMRRWLSDGEAFSEQEFVRAMESEGEIYFIAY